MKVLRLKLKNFRCHRAFDLRIDGQDLTVFGRNHLGKSTIGDALFWLLFGKNQNQRTGFEVRPLDPETMQPIPGLETTVEGEFEVNGKNLTLARTYREDWTKHRGTAASKKKGNTTDYKINDAPQSDGEYRSFIDGICDERTFRLLTSPWFFCSDDFGDSRSPAWQRRRALLLEICGDLTDTDVIDSKPMLEPLREILSDRRVDDYRRVLTARRKAVNEELDGIPIRIDQATQALPTVSTLTLEESEAIIADYRAKIAKCHENRANVTAGGAIAEKTTRIREIEGELLAIQNRLTATGSDDVGRAQTLIRAKDGEIADLRARVESFRRQAQTLDHEKQGLEDSLTRLRAEWKAISDRVYAGDATCPSCGQPLPEEQVAAAVDAFNARKSEQLKANRQRGTATKNQLSDVEMRLNGLAVQIETTAQRIEEVQLERASIEIPTATTVNPESDPEYRELLTEKEQLTNEIAELRAGGTAEIEKIDNAIRRFQTSLSEAEGGKARIEEKTRIEAQIMALTQREKELSVIFQEIEHETYLLEEFVRTKVSMLEAKINDRFQITSFKLFHQQQNEGITECCEAVKRENGVPFRDLSTSEQINVGLDIINVVSAHYGFTPFVVVDSCESNHDPLPTAGQQIRLVVSPADAALRFELTPRPLAEGSSSEPAQGQLISA